MADLDSLTILYLSYTGLLEPLGQSQVLNYLKKLAITHDIKIISFEKPEDLEKEKYLKKTQQKCVEAGLDWDPLMYHRTPRAAATLYDIYKGVTTACQYCKDNPRLIVHARSYIAMFIGLFLKRQYDVKLIFDIRGFWPEEMTNAGRLKRDSIMYRYLKKMEKKCIAEADYIVTLTQASSKFLKSNFSEVLNLEKVGVIPTCVDLNHFNIKSIPKEIDSDQFTLGCVGTVTGWFMLDWVMHFYKQLSGSFENSELKILSRDPEEIIYAEAEKQLVDRSSIDIESVAFENVPGKMRTMNAGIFFYHPSESEIARCPTKMAEFLACGVPCVANPGVGDVAHIINKYEVGVLVDNNSKNAMKQAVQDLKKLLADPQLSQRCRHAAEDWFSLDEGVKKYDKIYKQLQKDR